MTNIKVQVGKRSYKFGNGFIIVKSGDTPIYSCRHERWHCYHCIHAMVKKMKVKCTMFRHYYVS